MLKAIGNFIDSVMGNHYSQFLKALQKGDREAAIDIYQKKKTVRESIKPNEPLTGDTNSVLHYVAYLNMKEVYIDLLQNNVVHSHPDNKNGQRKNCLHLIAIGPRDSEKTDMMLVTLENGLNGMDIKHVLSEKDEVSCEIISLVLIDTCYTTRNCV